MIEKRYWDSNCFLAWLQNEKDRAGKCQDVLVLAERGEVEIVTSVLTVAEVLRLRPKDALPSERRSSVEALFNRPSIRTMMLTRRLAETARDLVWDHGIDPKDSIHVASALAAKVDVLNTFDGPLIGKSQQIGSPPLTIEEPTVTQPELDLEQPEDEEAGENPDEEADEELSEEPDEKPGEEQGEEAGEESDETTRPEPDGKPDEKPISDADPA